MSFRKKAVLVLLTLLTSLAGLAPVRADTVLGPWKPLFKGIDLAAGTNTPGGGGFPRLQVVHVARVDLQDPDIKLLPDGRVAGYVQNQKETAGYTTSGFLKTNKVQFAINANFFSPGDYYLPAGTPMTVQGLQISKGVVVSPQQSMANSSALLFDTNNVCTLLHTNWPATNNAKFYSAVSGDYPLVINGVNVGSRYNGLPDQVHQVNPRTAFGLSNDGRYLYLLTLDGRQPGYSEGSVDTETAAWLILAGAYNGVNMDGGGSTTMVIEGSAGEAIRVNSPSSVADSGKERTVGSHLGIFAKPLPGFINDIAVAVEDDSATLTWTTTSPSTSQAEYGLTVDATVSTALQSAAVNNHSVLITGLTPNTGYVARVLSTDGSGSHVSDFITFTTTSHATTNTLFEVTSSWKYAGGNMGSQPWTAPTFNDSAWLPGDGLLWIDLRAGGPNPDVQPKGTQVGFDGGTGFPYVTYYFRKHFTHTGSASLVDALSVTAYIDDGAVMYLNGKELYRLRMRDGAIDNTTLASGFACSGDATCPDLFEIRGDALRSSILEGDNVLAVEVHNYNARSPDMTFGLGLAEITQVVVKPTMQMSYSGGKVTIGWDRSGYTLQQAVAAAGPWVDVAGPVVASPYTVGASQTQLFFRLRK